MSDDLRQAGDSAVGRSADVQWGTAGHEDVGLRRRRGSAAAGADLWDRLMSDYEVTLVNDNSTLPTFVALPCP